MTSEKNTVLYVDDEENNLLLFEVVFSEHFRVLTTTSTEVARELLVKEEIKVVVSDLRMPEETGLEFINNVGPLYPNICFIILTAYLDVNSAMQAINQGHVYRYLLKPWDNNEIILTLKNAITAYDLRKENAILLRELKTKNFELEKTLKELKERENQFYNIFYSSLDGIIIYNRDRRILLANPAFYNFLQLSGQEALSIDNLLSGKQLESFNSRFDSAFKQQIPAFEYETRLLTGEKKVIEANSTHIKYSGEDAVLSILRDITERKNMAQHILSEVVQAEEKERNRLAADLHDGLGPILSTLKMYIEWLTDKSRNGNPDQILELSNKTIQEAIVQLRAISHNLSPHILEKFGLIPALQSQLDMIKSTSQTEFNLQSNLKDRFPHNLEISLFRVIKECINNTIKHSGAKQAFIRIEQNDKSVSVEYSDNGNGFEMSEISATGKGMGLYNIQNRIRSVNGEIEINSAKGQGIKVNATVVLEEL